MARQAVDRQRIKAQPQGDLLARIRGIWESAQTQAARSVNTAHVFANWLIGQQIVEAEQGVAKRAAYGRAILEALSKQLTAHYGEGFSLSALKYMHLFYQAYPDLLEDGHAARDHSGSMLAIGRALRDESAKYDSWEPGTLHSG